MNINSVKGGEQSTIAAESGNQKRSKSEAGISENKIQKSNLMKTKASRVNQSMRVSQKTGGNSGTANDGPSGGDRSSFNNDLQEDVRCRSPPPSVGGYLSKYRRRTSPRNSRNSSASNRTSAASDSTTASECDQKPVNNPPNTAVPSANSGSDAPQNEPAAKIDPNATPVSNSKRLMILSKKYLHETFEGKRWNRFTLGTLPRRRGAKDIDRSSTEEDDDEDDDEDEEDGEREVSGSLVSSTDQLEPGGNDTDVTPSAASIPSKTSQACQTSTMKISLSSVSTVDKRPRKDGKRTTRKMMEDKKVGDSLPRTKFSDGRLKALSKPVPFPPSPHTKHASIGCQMGSDSCLYENMGSDGVDAPPVPPKTYRASNEADSLILPPIPPREPTSVSTCEHLKPKSSEAPYNAIDSCRNSRVLADTGTNVSNCSLHCDHNPQKVQLRQPVNNPIHQSVHHSRVHRNSCDLVPNTCKRHSQVMNPSQMPQIDDHLRAQLEKLERRKSGSHLGHSSVRSHSCDRQSIVTTHQCPNNSTPKGYVPMYNTVMPSSTAANVAFSSQQQQQQQQQSTSTPPQSISCRNFSMMSNPNVLSNVPTIAVTSQPVNSQAKPSDGYTKYQRSRSQASTKEYPKPGKLSRFFSRRRSSGNRKTDQNYINFYQGQQNCHDTGTISQEIISAGEDAKQFALKRAALQKQLAASSNNETHRPFSGTESQDKQRASIVSNAVDDLALTEFQLSKTNPFYDQVLEELERLGPAGAGRPCSILPSSSSRSNLRASQIGPGEMIPRKDTKTQSLTLGDSARLAEKNDITRRLMRMLRFPFTRSRSRSRNDKDPTARDKINLIGPSSGTESERASNASPSTRPASYVSTGNNVEYFNRKSINNLNAAYLPQPATSPVASKPVLIAADPKSNVGYRTGSGNQQVALSMESASQIDLAKRGSRHSNSPSVHSVLSSGPVFEQGNHSVDVELHPAVTRGYQQMHTNVAMMPFNVYDTPPCDASNSTDGTMKSGIVSGQHYETLDGGIDVPLRSITPTHSLTHTDSASKPTGNSVKGNLDGVYVSKNSLQKLKETHRNPLHVKTNTEDVFSEVSTFPLNKTSPKSSPDGCKVSNKLQNQSSPVTRPLTKGSDVFVTVTINPRPDPASSGSVRSPKVPKRSPLATELTSKLPVIHPPSAPTVHSNVNTCWSLSAPPSVAVTPNRPSSFKFVELESSSTKGSKESNISQPHQARSPNTALSEQMLSSMNGVSRNVCQVMIDDLPDKLVTAAIPIAQRTPKSSKGPSPASTSPQNKNAPISYVPINNRRLDPIMSETSCDELEASAGFRTNSDSDEYKCLISRNTSANEYWKENTVQQMGDTNQQSDFERKFEDVVSEADCMSEAEFSTVDRTTYNSGRRVFGMAFWKNRPPNVTNNRKLPTATIAEDFNEAVNMHAAQMDSLPKESSPAETHGKKAGTQHISNREVIMETMSPPVATKNLRDLRDVDFSEFSRQLSLTEAFSVEDKVRGYQPSPTLHLEHKLSPGMVSKWGGGVLRTGGDVRGTPSQLSPPGGDAKSSSWGRGSVSSAISSVSSSRPAANASAGGGGGGYLLSQDECEYMSDGQRQSVQMDDNSSCNMLSDSSFIPCHVRDRSDLSEISTSG